MEPQHNSCVTKIILRKNKGRGIPLPEFKLYCKTIVTKQYGTGIKTDT